MSNVQRVFVESEGENIFLKRQVRGDVNVIDSFESSTPSVYDVLDDVSVFDSDKSSGNITLTQLFACIGKV